MSYGMAEAPRWERVRGCSGDGLDLPSHIRYAITAFELEAVDYLLKPFGTPRFLAALERARSIVRMREAAAQLDRARSIFSPRANAPFDRIFVRDGNAVLAVLLVDIERVEAQDDYVMIHTERKRYLVSLRIRNLEERLPNPPFLRIHRSHIVNLDHIDRMVGLDHARFEVRMKNGTVVPVSRARSQGIRRLSR
jgi:two-component system LytT family response regulator